MRDQGALHKKEDTFGKSPEELIHDLKITDGAARLYAHMQWRYGSNKRNFEGQKGMAEMLGVSEVTINKRVQELEAADWIVTIERGSSEKTGNFQTNFYHVFEVQEDCRAFREAYQPAEGERVRPKPEQRERKLRRGVGGNPKNLKRSDKDEHRLNSSSGGQHNLSWDGGINSSSGGQHNLSLDDQPNSSWDYPDSSYPDSLIQTQVAAASAAENAAREESQNSDFEATTQTASAPTPPPSSAPPPSPGEAERESVFDAYFSMVAPHKITIISGTMHQILTDAMQTYPAAWLIDAMAEAEKHEKRNWAYCEVILARWLRDGRDGKPSTNGAPKAAPIPEVDMSQPVRLPPRLPLTGGE